MEQNSSNIYLLAIELQRRDCKELQCKGTTKRPSTPRSDLGPLARLVARRDTLQSEKREWFEKNNQAGERTFFSLRARSMLRLGLPKMPVALSEFACLRS